MQIEKNGYNKLIKKTFNDSLNKKNMNNPKHLNNPCKGESSLSSGKDKVNNGVTKKLLQKYLSREVVIGVKRSSETIEKTTTS